MKILILEGDNLIQKIEFKNKFVFLVTEDKRVYHIDSSDGNMFRAEMPFKNLGKAHRDLVKKELK